MASVAETNRLTAVDAKVSKTNKQKSVESKKDQGFEVADSSSGYSAKSEVGGCTFKFGSRPSVAAGCSHRCKKMFFNVFIIVFKKHVFLCFLAVLMFLCMFLKKCFTKM